MMKQTVLGLLFVLLGGLLGFFLIRPASTHREEPEAASRLESGSALLAETPAVAMAEPHVAIVATGLDVPWGMDLLPNGDLMVAERNGRITRIDPGTGSKTQLTQRPALDQGEGGLLGLALDPNFNKTGWVFIYETVKDQNHIVRLKMEGETLIEEQVILQGIPKARYHNGGILRFGPDGYLYAGTGDGREPQSAQDTAGLGGKILRLTKNGEPAPGNPFNNAVYSVGHRNVQGLAWNAAGQLYATEHGPSGEIHDWCCHDEVNRITMGGNFGWPLVIGDEQHEGCILPLAHSGMDTWAPGGCVILRGSAWGSYQGWLMLAGLRGQQLRLFDLANPSVEQTVWLNGRFGRLRNLLMARDGSIYFCSSNRDGRGNPLDGDDKIYRMQPSAGR